MKRIIRWDDGLNDRKYILQKEYKEFGIYNRMAPNGFYVHQDWMISDGKITVVCESYNQLCEEELMDMIDLYDADGTFGVKAFSRDGLFVVHQSANMHI